MGSGRFKSNAIRFAALAAMAAASAAGVSILAAPRPSQEPQREPEYPRAATLVGPNGEETVNIQYGPRGIFWLDQENIVGDRSIDVSAKHTILNLIPEDEDMAFYVCIKDEWGHVVAEDSSEPWTVRSLTTGGVKGEEHTFEKSYGPLLPGVYSVKVAAILPGQDNVAEDGTVSTCTTGMVEMSHVLVK